MAELQNYDPITVVELFSSGDGFFEYLSVIEQAIWVEFVLAHYQRKSPIICLSPQTFTGCTVPF